VWPFEPLKAHDHLRRILFLSDLHCPYHDRRAFALFLQVAHAFQWDTLVSIGDFYDCYSVSSYTKDPRKEASLKRELAQGRKDCLVPLNKVKVRRKLLLKGNHDIRPDSYLKEKAPEWYEVFLEQDWFGFKSSGWEVYEYRHHASIGKLILTHDVAANGALAVLNAVQDNVVTGHDHQINYVIRGTALGVTHVSATFGWMGDMNHAEYMHNIKAMRNWSLGFGVGYLRPNGYIYLVPVPIIKGSCVVEGRLFTE
jgi:predicted phosphodiesterase